MRREQGHRPPFVLNVAQLLLQNRWLVFVGCIVLVVVIETIEHWPLYGLNRAFLSDVFFYGLLLPFLFWAFLTILGRTRPTAVFLAEIQAEATQAERQRIARDLHDRLAQNLSYLHLKLDQLATSDQAIITDVQTIQADLEQMRRIADDSYKQVRGTLVALREGVEIPADLGTALNQQAQTVTTNTGLEVILDYQDDIRPLCPLVKRAIIDITREALKNAATHAQARQVTVSLAFNEADALLAIADDGKGFSVSRTKAGHYGLEIMRERAEEVGGRLAIETGPEQGSKIVAQFPNMVVSEPLLHTCQHLLYEGLMDCYDETPPG